MLILLIVLATVVIVGLAAIALAEPRRARFEIVAWNDEAERRLLRERKIDTGWW